MKSSRQDGNFWYAWYPGDIRRDNNVQACSLTARGLWREMLDIMHDAPVRGTLTVGDSVAKARQISTTQLSRIVGISAAECQQLLSELEENGVFSTLDSGWIYNRRMYQESQQNASKRLAGSLGGKAKAASKTEANPRARELHSELNSHSEPILNPQARSEKADRRSADSARTERVESLVERFLQHETERNRGNGTRTLWRTRVEVMLSMPGGDQKVEALLNEVLSRRDPRAAATKSYSTEQIAKEAAWLNQQTLAWINEHSEASA